MRVPIGTFNNVQQREGERERGSREELLLAYHVRTVSLSTRKEASAHCVLNAGNVAEPPGDWHPAFDGPRLLVGPWFISSFGHIAEWRQPSAATAAAAVASLYVHLNADAGALYSSASIITSGRSLHAGRKN